MSVEARVDTVSLVTPAVSLPNTPTTYSSVVAAANAANSLAASVYQPPAEVKRETTLSVVKDLQSTIAKAVTKDDPNMRYLLDNNRDQAVDIALLKRDVKEIKDEMAGMKQVIANLQHLLLVK